MKIAVYAISKNEEAFVQRFCESAKDADLILIADTGSTDHTVEVARENYASVCNISVKPWRFDKARDTALALIPGDFDVCISLDLDEVLEPGWREEIERVWQPDTTRMRYQYDWGSGVVFYSDKIHSRHGYHWHHPVHECLRADGRINEVYAHTNKQLITHYPDPTKSRGQYMPLLELAVKEDPYCVRNAFYYARELTFHARWGDAITALKNYLDKHDATWAYERCYAMRLLGKAYEEIGQSEEALMWFNLAANQAPDTREPWVDLAMTYYKRQAWAACYHAATTALAIKDRKLVYTEDPAAWAERPHDLASISAWNLGKKEEAVQHLNEALKFAPEDERLLANLNLMTAL
jgi:glycosyltransferase involved in cell wall biosynthesis